MNKQIEEIAEILDKTHCGATECEECKFKDSQMPCFRMYEAEALYTAGYLKQIEGEWHWIADDSPMCNICGKVFDTNDDADAGLWNFCPNCGAKMKGDEGK